MASQVSPGILIKERDLTNAVVTGALAIRAAHASSFSKGPIGEIVNINTQKELIETFGAPTGDYAEDWMVASEFLNYGGRLAVVRTESTGALNASTSGTGVLIKNEEDWMSGTGSTETFAARTAGTWGNSLVGVLVDAGADYILTLASAPANVTIAAGDSLTFGSVTATVISGDEDALVVKANGAITSSSVLTDGGDTVAVTAVKDWYLNTSVEGVALSAIGPRPGSTQHALDNGSSGDAVHFAVIDRTGEVSGTAGTILERFTYLSKISDATDEEGGNIYFKNVINTQSRYLFHGAAPAVDANLGGVNALGTATANLGGQAMARIGAFSDRLEDGADGAGYTAGQFGAAMDLFLDTEETDIDFVLMGGSMSAEVDTKSKATKVIAIAAGRKDAIAFVSPHKGNQIASSGGALTSTQQKENTIAFFSDLTSTSYAVFDSGYKYVYDRFNDVYRYIPCNGDVAGLCVQTSNLQEDWYSPAGLNRGGILNAVKMAYNPNKADRDELYQNRINPVVGLRGQGITLFGDKTALSAPSAFDRINVRRLFLNLEKRARRLAEGVLFEQNDATTRAGFAGALNSYLSEVQARRGVTDFLVICDETNNTPDVIDRNEFVAEVYVKPTRSINFITVTFTATKTGVTFSEVVGR
ncbi:tail sheath monomer [Cyanophage S-RIM32]|uniref:Tail sheath monomer n=1 Tax=Cyanophage S-RIM32 TaxID=1278479 RepID=A0A127KMB2_9CAUD|nr:tail sheath [Cyanophage S-RIM32]AMO43135.1 tail sheath monomer [Cyanophage S-RIM32]